jgi:hypothetical protein
LALVGAWCCVLMVGASAATADNAFPPDVNRTPGSRTVTSSTGDWVPEPDGYTYSWYRCTSPLPSDCTQQIPGATGPAYVLRTADIGFRIRSRVAASSGDPDPTFSATAEGPIVAAPPKNTVAPRVTGTPRNQLALGVTPGTWTGRVAGDPGFTYQWQRCTTTKLASCSSIPGATKTTYLLGPGDIGRYMRVVVGAEGLGRAQAAAPNPPVGPVQDVAAASPRRLSPFPVLVIAGRLRGGTTRISDFVVRGPRRAKVSVRCRGKRCPFGRIGGTIGKRKRLRFRRAQRTFRAGQVLEIRVTGRNRIGKFTRVTFRRGRAPRRSDLCLMPAAKKPSRCPGT